VLLISKQSLFHAEGCILLHAYVLYYLIVKLDRHKKLLKVSTVQTRDSTGS